MGKRNVAKRSRRAKRHPSTSPRCKITRPSPSQSTSPTVEEKILYRCSRCGLVENPTRHTPRAAEMPDVSQIGDEPLWQECPDEGPENLQLIDLNDPRRQRQRCFFNYGEISGRVCTPFLREEMTLGTRIGSAMPWPHIQCEWYVRQYVRKRSHAKEMDLANLLPAHRVVLENQQRLKQHDSGHWHLSPPQSDEGFDWLNEILSSGVQLPSESFGDLLEVARILNRTDDEQPPVAPASSGTTLDITVDLRYWVKEQLDRQYPVIQQIQSYLLQLSGREKPFERDRQLAKRRFKVYAFTKYFDAIAFNIGRIVSPDEDPKKAAEQVKQDRKFLRRVLGKARVIRGGQ